MRTRQSAARQRGWAWVPWAISAVAGAIASDKARKATNQANDMSLELANTSLQRRAADARAAGLHPLAVLGGGGSNVPAIQVPDYGWINNLGQDLSRAWQANQSSPERAESVIANMRQTERNAINAIDQRRAMEKVDSQNDALFAQRLEKGALELELMRQQIFRNNASGQLPPPRPRADRGPNSPGDVPASVAPVGATKVVPGEVTSRAPGDSATEAGQHPAWRRVETAPGVFRWIPSPSLNLDSELAHAAIAGQMYWDRWNWSPPELSARDYAWSRKRFNFGRGAPMYGPWTPNRKGL